MRKKNWKIEKIYLNHFIEYLPAKNVSVRLSWPTHAVLFWERFFSSRIRKIHKYKKNQKDVEHLEKSIRCSHLTNCLESGRFCVILVRKPWNECMSAFFLSTQFFFSFFLFKTNFELYFGFCYIKDESSFKYEWAPLDRGYSFVNNGCTWMNQTCTNYFLNWYAYQCPTVF